MKADPKRMGIGAVAIAAMTALFVLPHEGLRTETYADPIGVPTVCVGETGTHVKPGAHYSVEQCMQMLDERLQRMWQHVAQCIAVPLQPHEAMAVLSWTYNVGVNAACRSTLMTMLNRGDPPAVWCAQLSRWVYAGGHTLPGLVARRQAERNLCEGKTRHAD